MLTDLFGKTVIFCFFLAIPGTYLLELSRYGERGREVKFLLYTVILVLDALVALGLIATVLLQSGRSAGMSGAIAGGAETLFGKKKGLDEFFGKVSAVLAGLFLVLTLLLSVV